MNFYVPFAEDDAEKAELIWGATRLFLHEMGFPTRRRRISALSLHPDVEQLVAVGEETPDGEIVQVILEASDMPIFYCCTVTRGIFEGPPYPLALKEHGRVFDFDEEVVSWGEGFGG